MFSKSGRIGIFKKLLFLGVFVSFYLFFMVDDVHAAPLGKITMNALCNGKTFTLSSNVSNPNKVVSNVDWSIKWNIPANTEYISFKVIDVTKNQTVFNQANAGKSNLYSLKKNSLTLNHTYKFIVTANSRYYQSSSAVAYVKSIKASSSSTTPTTKATTFKITSPANKAKIATSSKINVKWNAYSGAKEYCVYAIGSSSKKSTRRYYTKSTSVTIPAYSLSAGAQGLYVMALNSSRASLAKKGINITLSGANKTLGSPKISYTVASTGKVTFSASASNATHYYYSIYDKTAKKNLVGTTCSATISKIAKSGLTSGHSYTITVTACIGNCYKSSSLTYANLDTSRIKKSSISFTYKKTTATNKPAKVDMKVNNVATSGLKITLNKANLNISWKSVSGATGYYLVFYDYWNAKNLIKGSISSSYCKNGVYTYTVPSSKLTDGRAYNIKVYSTNSKYGYSSGAQYDEVNVFLNASTRNYGYVMLGSARDDIDKVRGDSSGQETVVKQYVDAPWYYHIRPRNKGVAEKLAYACEFLANNNNVNVGYSGNMDKTKSAQLGMRDSLFNAVVAANGNLNLLKGQLLDADCSGFVSSCLAYAFHGTNYSKYVTKAFNTNELEEFLVTKGVCKDKQFDVVQTVKFNQNTNYYSKYTPLDTSLMQRGDIVIRPASKAHLFDSSMNYGHSGIIVSVGNSIRVGEENQENLVSYLTY